MSKNNEIVTPINSVKKLVECFDAALINLDNASDHFETAVLKPTLLEDDIALASDPVKRDEILSLLENYSLMANFLLDHPLLGVIRQIRDERVVDEGHPTYQAYMPNIVAGQTYRHYKGCKYVIDSVSNNSNQPLIMYINYTSGDGRIWTLTSYEFHRMVEWEGKAVPRFTLIEN